MTDGYGEGTATTLTARTSDKRLAVTYIPSLGTASRKLTVNLGRFARPVTVRWYNPTNGRWTTLDGGPFPNRDSRSLATPGDNGTKTNDWILVLEAH